MKAYRKDGNIIIEINENALIEAGPTHPEAPYKVTNREEFLNHVVECLPDIGDDNDNHSCSDLTKLLDRCVEDAVMSGAGADIADEEDDD